MSFRDVFSKYIDHVAKQMDRRNRQSRDAFTENEEKALQYYAKAANQLRALGIELGEEGFREYEHLRFADPKEKPQMVSLPTEESI